jgi:hypothetical protein
MRLYFKLLDVLERRPYLPELTLICAIVAGSFWLALDSYDRIVL